MITTCLIIPCFNESMRLKDAVFLNFLEVNDSFSLLFIDDGSTDSTIDIIKKMSTAHQRCHYLQLKKNAGKAEAVRKGFAFIEKKFPAIRRAGFWDADLATPLDEAVRFDRIFCERKEILAIVGSRHLRLGTQIKRNPLRHYLGRIFSTIVSMMLKLPVYDTQCGAKVFDRSLWDVIFSHPFKGSYLFDVEIFLRLKQYRKIHIDSPYIVEVSLRKWQDVGGSKLGILDFLKAPIELVRIYRSYIS